MYTDNRNFETAGNAYCLAALGYCQSFFEKSKNIVISNSTFTNVKKYAVIELE
jgi:hypothetical protein